MSEVVKGPNLFDNEDQKRGLKGKSRLWSVNKQRVIRERDRGLCIYCGNPGKVIDHVLPARFGGPTITANGALSCHECNYQKAGAISIGFLTYAFGHLLRSDEDMAWVSDFWNSSQRALDQSLIDAASVPAGEHWKFPPVKTKSGYKPGWQADALAKARAAVKPKVTGLPRAYQIYSGFEDLVKVRYENNRFVTADDLVSLGIERHMVYKLLDALVKSGKWRDRVYGEIILMPGIWGAGRPSRVILPVK